MSTSWYVGLRTDKPEAELHLLQGVVVRESLTWEANRQLAATIHHQIETLLGRQGLVWQDVEGLACYKGPGSFTGLRIGLTVANAMAYGLNVPVVSEAGDEWLVAGALRLAAGGDEGSAQPFYGGEANITAPRK